MDGVIGIAEMAKRTGLSAAVLRSWESRYGFPQPLRLPNGRRGYHSDDVQRVHDVLRARGTGLSLAAAIRRAQNRDLSAASSVFAAVQRSRPETSPLELRKRPLIALSRAIEDEYLARGGGGVICASFQEERFYRASQHRWAEIARTSRAALVFAAFDRLRVPPKGPVEIPLPGDHPLLREWALAAEGPGFTACLTAWERPDRAVADERDFESVWTVEPASVRAALDVFLAVAHDQLPRLTAAVRAGLSLPPVPSGDEGATASRVAARMVDYAMRAA